MENKLIALYLRLSLEDVDSRKGGTDESNSITNQRSVLTNYIKNHPELKDMKTIEFVDDGYTGTNFVEVR